MKKTWNFQQKSLKILKKPVILNKINKNPEKTWNFYQLKHI